jgi:pyruvate formate lyase activating enzyme
MLIGGLLKFSLIDYPGKVAAVVFTQGCNYRCPFCHNPELVLPESFNTPIPVEDVMAFLAQRRGQLQGVVITGGEPTLHDDLKDVIRRIKAMGFLVKLDTNGSRPDMLVDILNEKLVDLVAMDIKSSLQGYCKATGVKADLECVKRSIALIKASGVAHLFRTTVLRGIVSEENVHQIKALLEGTKNYKLQRGNLNGRVLNRDILDGPGEYSDMEWERLKGLVF